MLYLPLLLLFNIYICNILEFYRYFTFRNFRITYFLKGSPNNCKNSSTYASLFTPTIWSAFCLNPFPLQKFLGHQLPTSSSTTVLTCHFGKSGIMIQQVNSEVDRDSSWFKSHWCTCLGFETKPCYGAVGDL